MNTPPSRSRLRRTASRWYDRVEGVAAERPVHLAFYVLLGVSAIVIPISLPFYLGDTASFLENLAAEAHGMIFDLLVIGWFMFWLQRQGERRLRSNRYREEIEDFLGWDTAEASLRIAGNVRRLNRLGVTRRLTLTEAHLSGAGLSGALLSESDLWGADLTGAMLGGAHLDGSNLAGVRLQGANLERAQLHGADLRGSDLTEASLERAHLESADLRAADLTGCDLQFASLPSAQLERACLFRANLRGARLDRASLKGALLERANLQGAHLNGADLRECALEGADFTDASLADARLPEGDALVTLFCGVKSLARAQFNDAPRKTLHDNLPHLFEQHAAV